MASVESTSGVLHVVGDYAVRIDLAHTLERIKSVARNPGSDSDLAVILVACIALAVAIVVLLLLILITPSEKTVRKTRRYRLKPGQEPPDSDKLTLREQLNTTRAKPPSKLFMALTGNLAIAIVLGIAAAAVYVGTSSDRYCAETCHGTSGAVHSATRQAHARCVQCHEAPLVRGALSNSLSRLRMGVGSLIGSEIDGGPTADSTRCLSCHGDKISRGVLVGDKGIAMSHAETLDGGVPCTRCHRGVGHLSGVSTAAMNDCITCHDGTKASADCETCHRKDPSATAFKQNEAGRIVGTGNITYPAVRAARRECGLCHDEAKTCDPCHGIRMPHSKAFIEGGHARPAAFRAKLKCYKCHDPVDCGKCHSSFDPSTGTSAHGANWKSEHRRSSWKSGCVCHSTHSTRTDPICIRCHPEHYAR